MAVYKIAELYTEFEPFGETLAKQGLPYLCGENNTPDFSVQVPIDIIKKKQKENPHLTMNDCEYIFTGSEFYSRLLQYNGFLLHSSAVAYKNRAYLFSAPCGTGKSTHTFLWQKRFGDEVKIINDDKPAIRLIDDTFYVFGTPFSGKTDLNLNIRVPLKAICILERADKNSIELLKSSEAILPLLNQTLRPSDNNSMDILLSLLDRLLKEIPVYKLKCNISEEAAELACSVMSADNE